MTYPEFHIESIWAFGGKILRLVAACAGVVEMAPGRQPEFCPKPVHAPKRRRDYFSAIVLGKP